VHNLQEYLNHHLYRFNASTEEECFETKGGKDGEYEEEGGGLLILWGVYVRLGSVFAGA